MKLRSIGTALLAASLAACLTRADLPNSPGGGTTFGGQPHGSSDGGLDAGTCHLLSEVFYPAGTELVALGSAKLNGDARPDLVAAGGNTLTVWWTAPDGGLTSTEDRSTAGSTAALAMGDFDGDGRTDVAVANGQPQNSTQLFLGLEDGGLDDPVTKPGRPYVQAVAAGDFDEDGRADLGLADDSLLNGEVFVVLNPGAALPGQLPLDLTRRRAGIVAADFTQDGHLDLAATDPLNGDVTLYEGRADGGFTTWPSVRAGTAPGTLAAADMDGNGTLDIVTPLRGESALGVLLATDAGVFDPGVAIATEGTPIALAAGDWGGLGGVGVVTAESAPDALGFFRVTDGGLASVGFLTPSAAPKSVTLVDLDGDGRLDVVALLDGGIGVYRATCP